MSGIHLRLMAASDWDACKALTTMGDESAQLDFASQDDLRRFLARNPFMNWVAYDDSSRVIGCVLCSTDSLRGYLYDLVVEPTHRRQGIGEQLLNRALQGLQKFGIPRAVMTTARNNHKLGLMLVEHGWQVSEELAFYTTDLSIGTHQV